MTEVYYPSAVQMPASPTNFRRAGRRTYTHVVIHCTDGRADPRATASMWASPGHGSSAHLVVGQDATVVQCVRLDDIAWHAHAANGTSVGIEHCARSPGELSKDDPGMPPTQAQLQASARLVVWLCRNAGLPITRDVVKGHAEIDPQTTHLDCPVRAGIDLDALVQLANAMLSSSFAF